MPKPKIAIASLTCCEGCQVAILDLGERFLDLAKKVIVSDFAFTEEKSEPGSFDIVFIEGTPITKENQERLKILREKSKTLVAIGACACLGGIQEIKNYQDKEEKIKYVYKNIEGINNPDIKPLKEFVMVDLEIPGCPINNEEFLEIFKKLLAGMSTEAIKIPQRPVCYECQLKQNECLLQKDLLAHRSPGVGGPCLGPIMLAGCGAPCPTNNYSCDGCRGPIKNVNADNLNKLLGEKYTQKEIDLIIQRFGGIDAIYPLPPIKK